MKMSIPETPVKRMALGIGAGVVFLVFVGLIYLASSDNSSPQKIDGLRIVAAAHGFTRQLIASRQVIPKTVSLNELVTRGFLKPEDVAPFHGMETELMLTASASNPNAPIMRVHLPDGSYLVLFNDGTTRQETAQ